MSLLSLFGLLGWFFFFSVVLHCHAVRTTSEDSREFLKPLFEWVTSNGGWINEKRLDFRFASEARSLRNDEDSDHQPRRSLGVFLRDPSTLVEHGTNTNLLFDPSDVCLESPRDFPPQLPSSSFKAGRQPTWGADPVLLQIPRQLFLTAESPQLQRTSRARVEQFDTLTTVDKGIRSYLRLAVAVAGELHSPTSFWTDYLRTFSWQSTFIGALGSDQDIEFLKAVGENDLIGQIKAFQENLQFVYVNVFTEPEDISFREFSLIACTVLSRCQGGAALVPLLDLFRPNPNVIRNNRFFDVDGALVMKVSVPWTDVPVCPGEELFITQGPMNDNFLSFQYGEVLHLNRNNRLCVVGECYHIEQLRFGTLPQSTVEVIESFASDFQQRFDDARSQHPPEHSLFLHWTEEQLNYVRESLNTLRFTGSLAT